jgi:lantibiotic leader peptide-processing serine protease
MNRFVRLSLILLLITIVAIPALAQGVKKNYVIVANGQGPGSTSFSTLLGSDVTATIEDMGLVLASSADPNFAARVAQMKDVQWVSEDQVVQWLDPNEKNLGAEAGPLAEPAYSPANVDRFVPLQWYLRQVRADQTAAMNIRGNSKVRARVAVVDQGMILSHPDIAPNVNVALSTSFVPGEGVNPPANGGFNHGTHVGGIIAAPINSIGTQGIAPEAELVAVKVLSAATGSGSFTWIIEGINYASGPLVHADIINMSLGYFGPRKPVNPGDNKGGWGGLISALNRAVNMATQRGSLVISAAGNNGADLNSNYINIPAQSGNGMGVAALGPIGWGINGDPSAWNTPAYYSNYGQSVVNVSAPGGNDMLYGTPEGNALCTVGVNPAPSVVKTSCWVFDMVMSPAAWQEVSPGVYSYYYSWADGTSMATPVVSGVAALIVGENGHMKPAQLKALLEKTSVPIWQTPVFGKGRVDALNAVGK